MSEVSAGASALASISIDAPSGPSSVVVYVLLGAIAGSILGSLLGLVLAGILAWFGRSPRQIPYVTTEAAQQLIAEARIAYAATADATTSARRSR